MPSTITINMNKKPIYDIKIENDFAALPETLKALGFEGKRAAIVSDSNVAPLYADEIKGLLEGVCSEVFICTFEAGEKSKNMDTVMQLLKQFVEHRMNRHDLVIALGGGVVGDVAGFCAAIYMRGIDVIQVPTSLLAQVDSSVGGKTGVDLDAYKNTVGAFKMPRLVYINISTLKSLDVRQYYAGMGEVMKYGLIMDASFYEWIISKMYEIHDRDADILEEMVAHCCTCKQRIVERDPHEEGDRALLNFGHTIGHAIEKYKEFELLHGECVALGCVAAAYISYKRGKLSTEEYYEVRDMFVPFKLPISIDNIDAEKIAELTRSDKKAMDSGIKFILLKRVGKAYIDTAVTQEEILEGIREIEFREDNE